MDNRTMKPSLVLAHNLTSWMAASRTLDTLEKVAARSGVGFGSIRRIKSGDANPTIETIADVARAFHKTAIDFLTPPEIDNVVHMVQEPAATYHVPNRLVESLLDAIEVLNDRAVIELTGAAKQMAKDSDYIKSNPVASFQ